MKVTLHDDDFIRFYAIGKSLLDRLEADRFLAPAYEAMGKKPKVPRYGGWEAKGVSGQTLGHYMSALSFCYASDGSESAKQKAIYCVDELATLQCENGYIAGIPEKESFGKVYEHPDDFTSKGFELGGWWVPYYSLHKIFRGFLDIYENIGYEKALDVAKKLGVWVYNTTSTLNNEQRLRVLCCEYGGMNDVLARLYHHTGDERFLKSAKFFCEEKLLDPLAKGEDKLTSLHANTQIPKIVGAVSVGEENYIRAAENFWNFVAKDRAYAIGGHSISEHFEDLGKETLASDTCETCNTNNMIQLTKKLWKLSHKSEYYDFIEKVMFNHILASQDENGMKTYFVGMKPGNFKVYSTPDNSFWCCFGSGLENPFTIFDIIYNYDNGLYVNLFVSSDAESEECSVSLKKLAEDRFSLEFAKAFNGPVYIRKPARCRDFSVNFNGRGCNETENGYIKIEADFAEGDAIYISVPSTFEIHCKRDDRSMVYFTYGPYVLAERLGDAPCDDHAKESNDFKKKRCKAPAPLKSCVAEKTAENEFEVDGHKLIPFYKIVHGRYSIYFKKGGISKRFSTLNFKK